MVNALCGSEVGSGEPWGRLASNAKPSRVGRFGAARPPWRLVCCRWGLSGPGGVPRPPFPREGAEGEPFPPFPAPKLWRSPAGASGRLTLWKDPGRQELLRGHDSEAHNSVPPPVKKLVWGLPLSPAPPRPLRRRPRRRCSGDQKLGSGQGGWGTESVLGGSRGPPITGVQACQPPAAGAGGVRVGVQAGRPPAAGAGGVIGGL